MHVETATVGGIVFQIRKVPAYPDQLLLAKAVMPVMADLMPVIIKLIENKDLREKAVSGQAAQIPPEFLVEMLEAAFGAVQKLSAEDLLNLTRRSLAAVQRKQGEAGWADVMTPTGQMMFADLDLRVILELVFKVVEVNLLGFFFGGPGTSPAGAQTA